LPTSRPDFCGWSAFGPISLLIEDVIGLGPANADARKLSWRLVSKERCGVRNYRFADLVAEPDGTLNVTSNAPYTLDVNGMILAVKPGENRFAVKLTP